MVRQIVVSGARLDSSTVIFRLSSLFGLACVTRENVWELFLLSGMKN